MAADCPADFAGAAPGNARSVVRPVSLTAMAAFPDGMVSKANEAHKFEAFAKGTDNQFPYSPETSNRRVSLVYQARQRPRNNEGE